MGLVFAMIKFYVSFNCKELRSREAKPSLNICQQVFFGPVRHARESKRGHVISCSVACTHNHTRDKVSQGRHTPSILQADTPAAALLAPLLMSLTTFSSSLRLLALGIGFQRKLPFPLLSENIPLPRGRLILFPFPYLKTLISAKTLGKGIGRLPTSSKASIASSWH